VSFSIFFSLFTIAVGYLLGRAPVGSIFINLFPHALSTTHTQHHLAWQSFKQHSPGASWNSQHAYTLLKQRLKRWLGHVVRMDDEWIPKDLLYGELAQESAPLAGPKYAIKMYARRTWRLWTLTSTDRKPWLQNGQIRSGQFAHQSLKRHLPNGLRQRDKRKGDRPATDHTRRSSRTTNQRAIP